ncbi:ATP-dependent helicase/nuclease subunit B [Breznakia sp. PF5-3]|uniref:PD-(D/E)XK nuclease family protein n=1 Tax=unclassified Breznakia TaxID=2623764 RepID=UPI0024073FEB|nr:MULTISPECIES: PD-(D/E)XK nuclease family protein [unclassified Breznakia]MDF9824268.1 ATP-dependent helicase/nuclease subunit B [Breznakia sp. PM6-1]MDF9835492.1 ATP-dependent helicase/nuclease subunit B [Breznakia sp. PF5-3]MDF9838034.1 ATP-dependent helicase/nuclease subunit B [Breznakia sp. PFB2-8]MDF9859412.1 ATP-dependent helicase/nuclease subunit B [Breznakia sp. PH5-24]
MRLQDIKKDAIILADSYLHTEIRMQLLDQQDALANVSVMTLTTYLNNLASEEEDAIIYEYYKILATLDLHVFKKVALTGDFIDEVLQFVKDIKRYQIDVETLPEHDRYQQELKKIIKAVVLVPLQLDYQLSELKKQTDFHNFYILDYNSNVFKERVYEELVSKGAVRLDIEIINPHKEFYYVLNKREEVEALARYIIEHDIDVQASKLTILNTEYEGFIEQIFKRYHIPYSFVSSTSKNRLLFKYLCLIEYYLNPSMDTLLNVVKEEVFRHPYISDFMEYVSTFKKTLHDSFTHIQDATITKDIVNDIEYKQLVKLESHANEVKELIAKQLLELETLSPKQALMKIDEIVNENHYFSSVDDLKTVRKIRSQMKDMIPYIDVVPMQLFLHVLEKLQVRKKEAFEGMLVAGLNEPLGVKDYHFVLGASSDNYPNFQSLGGIFSEQYVKEIDYPNIEKRFALHEQNLKNNLCSSNHLVVFYATSSLAGKEKEAALEVETFMEQDAQYYALSYNRKGYELNTQLDTKISKQLFYPNDIFKGSITSYEMYSNCPFKYFVRHGLKIPEPMSYEFDSAKVGTLMHYVLEMLVKTYGKAYADQTSEVIENLLDKKIAELQTLYPYMKEQIAIVRKGILDSLEKNLHFLSEMEKDSSLTPSKSEERFDYEFHIDNEVLQLYGYIDRINENNDFISIIDYKSSAKKLKEEEVFACLKLQLLTYLVVSAKHSTKRPLGAYYYSLGNKQQSAEYAKYQKRTNEIVENTKEDREADFLKSKKLEGWTTSEDIEAMDTSLEFINGVGYKQDGSYASKTNIYDIKGLEQLCIRIYKGLLGEIKAGNMDIIPTTCDFCKYGSICHYKGRKYEREQITVDDDLYLVHKGKRRDS